MTHLSDLLLSWFEDLEGADQIVVDAHQGSRVVELSAVVGGRKDGDKLSFSEELVALFHHLMRPAHQVQIMLLAEHLHIVRSKGERHSSLVFTPALSVFVRV